jgi:hypothetical protein
MNLFNQMDISSVVGDMLSGLIIGFFTYLGVRATLKFEKQKYQRELRTERFNNKPEFRISKAEFKSDEEADIAAICTIFKHHFDENDRLVIDYNPELLDKNNLIYFDYELKNIGKSAIEYTVVATHRQQNTTLTEIEDFKYLYDSKIMNYDCYFDKKIFPGESLKLRIYYNKDSGPMSMFSSNLILMFQDEYGTYWKQSFFEDRLNLYSPRIISHKEFRIYTTIDTALDCFKNPWKW